MKKGQSTAEYAIVIGLVIAAVVAMQVYVKRGLQGKMKKAVDYKYGSADAGVSGVDTSTVLKTTQYEPYYATSSITSERKVNETTEVTKGGGVSRTLGAEGESSSRTGSQTVTAAENNP